MPFNDTDVYQVRYISCKGVLYTLCVCARAFLFIFCKLALFYLIKFIFRSSFLNVFNLHTVLSIECKTLMLIFLF